MKFQQGSLDYAWARCIRHARSARQQFTYTALPPSMIHPGHSILRESILRFVLAPYTRANTGGTRKQKRKRGNNTAAFSVRNISFIFTIAYSFITFCLFSFLLPTFVLVFFLSLLPYSRFACSC